MKNEIMSKLQTAMNTLDRIADTYGVARATHIILLAESLLDLKRFCLQLLRENADLKAKIEDLAEAMEANEKEVT